MAADSLVARRRAMPSGGWAWRSSIQAPHYQTDRDVGAASIGEGLLAAYAVTRRPPLPAGRRRGRRLPARGRRAGRGRPALARLGRSRRAAIDDALHELRRRRRRDQRPPVEAVQRSRVSGASATARSRGCAGWSRRPAGRPAPRPPVRGDGPTTATGASPTTESAWARRASSSRSTPSQTAPANRTFRTYARAGAARLRALTEDGARPLPRGSESATLETGFLSGSTGAAYMFLERYRSDRDPVDLATGHRLLRWVNERAVADPSGGLRWPLAEDDASSPSGFELGAAGIAWVNLHAARLTGRRRLPRGCPPRGHLAPTRPARRGAWRELPGHADVAGARRPRQRRRRDRLGARGSRRSRHRRGCEPAGRPLGPRRPARRCGSRPSSERSGTSIGRGRARRLPAEPSWHWGAAGSPPSRPGSAAGPGRAPGGQREA